MAEIALNLLSGTVDETTGCVLPRQVYRGKQKGRPFCVGDVQTMN